MSNTADRSASSPGVSRSNSRVASPVSCRAEATARLRGLCRLLPLPWAKTTTPAAPAGTERVPGRPRPPPSTTTSRSSAAPAGAADASSRSTSSSPVWEKSA